LPNGILSYQVGPKFWYIFIGLGIDFLKYLLWPVGINTSWSFQTIWQFWYIFWSLVIFTHFGMMYQDKSGNPVGIVSACHRGDWSYG
jgi:hypothetical protein